MNHIKTVYIIQDGGTDTNNSREEDIQSYWLW